MRTNLRYVILPRGSEKFAFFRHLFFSVCCCLRVMSSLSFLFRTRANKESMTNFGTNSAPLLASRRFGLRRLAALNRREQSSRRISDVSRGNRKLWCARGREKGRERGRTTPSFPGEGCRSSLVFTLRHLVAISLCAVVIHLVHDDFSQGSCRRHIDDR